MIIFVKNSHSQNFSKKCFEKLSSSFIFFGLKLEKSSAGTFFERRVPQDQLLAFKLARNNTIQLFGWFRRRPKMSKNGQFCQFLPFLSFLTISIRNCETIHQNFPARAQNRSQSQIGSVSPGQNYRFYANFIKFHQKWPIFAISDQILSPLGQNSSSQTLFRS